MSASKYFKALFTRPNLIKTFNKHIAEGSAIGVDRIRPHVFYKNIGDEVDGISNRVHTGAYRFTSYKQKLISKGPNKYPRVISIPTVRDRLTLRVLCDVLLLTYKYLNPEIPQIKIEALVHVLNKGKYSSYIKIDLSSFYTSIPQERLFKVLRRKVRKAELLKLIIGAVETPTVVEGCRPHSKNSEGVPQGLAISNVLAEIFINDFDLKMSGCPGIFYQRYVDDILILCDKSQADEIASNAITALQELGLSPHPIGPNSKSSIGELSNSFDYLGYQINGNIFSVRKSTINKFESAIAKIFTAYRYQLTHAKTPLEKTRAEKICEWRLNLRITGCIFQEKRLGWMFYFSQINTSTPLRAIDSTIRSMLTRFSLDGKIKVKSMVKAYYETKIVDKSAHKYIPNFDEMSVLEKRHTLTSFLGAKHLHKCSDAQVEAYFKMRIGAVVKELEKDLLHLS